MSTVPTPAQSLIGHNLNGGWTVIASVAKPGTGGHLSECYIVQHKNGTEAFLKAIVYIAAFNSPNVADNLRILTSEFTFERDICEYCKDKKLNRIVKIITHGEITINPSIASSKVSYLIFEKADSDIRRHLDVVRNLELAWSLRKLHQIASSLTQLHYNDIAHQDLKPSNCLTFNGDRLKVSDLGRASIRGLNSEHDGLDVAGDRGYSPPELLYGYRASEWNIRRFGCDAYLFGSMVYTLLTSLSITTVLIGKLDNSHKPVTYFGGGFRGVYTTVIPYLQNAFSEVLREFKRDFTHIECIDELTEIIRNLCEPDPGVRGHPRDRAESSNSYSLRRYISILDRLASKEEFRLRKTSI